MAQLSKDLQLDETKFNNASRDMKALKKRTNELKTKLEGMHESLASAMDTPAGKEVQLEAKKTLLKPVENMALVVGHISDTLELVIGNNYYKDVFDGFDELKNLL